MRHPINPLVDYAFKRLLGAEPNKNLTRHFLNAILRPQQPIQDVTLVNPFNDRDFAEDKLSVVDVKARDALGRTFHIEVQVLLHRGLRPRMLYTWADLYQAQLVKGHDYKTLEPVTSIWLLDEVMLSESPAVHHRFTAFDRDHRVTLCDHLSLHVIELPKLRREALPLDDEQRWCTFLSEARYWTALPDALNTPELRQAMSTLIEISDQEREYYNYASRLDQLRVKATIEASARQAQEQLEAAKAQLKDTESRLDVAESKLDVAESKLDATESRLQRARQASLDAGLDPDALLDDTPDR